MKNIQFSAQFVQDQFIQLEANSDIPLSKLLPAIGSSLRNSGPSQVLTDYKILIARQYSGDMSELIQDINLQNGDYVILVQPLMTTVKLVFHLPNQRPQEGLIITQQEILIGRRDETARVFPDLDLTQWLVERGKDPKKISRQLAWMREKGDKWEISLHSDAKSTIYIDRTRLEPGARIEIKDENILSFGSSLDKPDLRLVVRLMS